MISKTLYLPLTHLDYHFPYPYVPCNNVANMCMNRLSITQHLIQLLHIQVKMFEYIHL